MQGVGAGIGETLTLGGTRVFEPGYNPPDEIAYLIGKIASNVLLSAGGFVVAGGGVAGGIAGAPVTGGASVAAGTKVVIAGGTVMVSGAANAIANSAQLGTLMQASIGKSGNSNPYNGPVDGDIIVVDPNGNAMPVKQGQQIQGSPNGKVWQVKDKYGNYTNERLDGYGHPNQKDPKAQVPHGHRVDGSGNSITDSSGNPHLPINPPKK